MEPNKMGIGRFLMNSRYLDLSRLFLRVYRVRAYIPTPNLDIGRVLDEVAFIHGGPECGVAVPGYYINENGYCTQCGKFLAPHKTLETISGLKELTG